MIGSRKYDMPCGISICSVPETEYIVVSDNEGMLHNIGKDLTGLHFVSVADHHCQTL